MRSMGSPWASTPRPMTRLPTPSRVRTAPTPDPLHTPPRREGEAPDSPQRRAPARLEPFQGEGHHA
jgi:hypothetical protein